MCLKISNNNFFESRVGINPKLFAAEFSRVAEDREVCVPLFKG